ncbi:KAP family P-loop NTPase fold protein [Halomonas sp. BC04]|uniref:KAP family P-loop NTPase fold protein n=1 Tax=Halomonas sp. BC04 TaxID=1403540 RepID=UPI0003ED77B9|nr:P-loop NTPase fold protein [Halomonas sp. BC04]EWH02048.1 hypothetical protein Q427_10850 [Halomonas sp. BC04]
MEAAWENDLLGRDKVASFIQRVVETNESIKVVNIDSPWGTGKTFFLHNWCQELRENRGVVLINAWKNDYTGDPFVSLVANIIQQLESQVGMAACSEIEEFRKKASKAVVASFPMLAKEVLKGVVGKFSGFDVDKAMERMYDEYDKAAEDLATIYINRNEEQEAAVEQFNHIFSELVSKVSENLAGGDEAGPVYIFIDELDRCRPPYALELLERIKHFFEVPGCRFIVATDTRQLEHSIRAVYGEGFDSYRYLKRFFDITYGFDNSAIDAWIKSSFIFPEVDRFYKLGFSVKEPKRQHGAISSLTGQRVISGDASTVFSDRHELNETQLIVLALCKTFSVSLRDAQKIFLKINSVMLNLNQSKISFYWLCYLVFLKDADPDLYGLIAKREGEGLKKGVEEKYPGYNLYFGTRLENVHDIAQEFCDLCFSDSGNIRSRFESNKQYVVEIAVALSNDEIDLRKYINLVDLASGVE